MSGLVPGIHVLPRPKRAMPHPRQTNSWMVGLRRPWRRGERGSPAAVVLADRHGWSAFSPGQARGDHDDWV